MRPSRLAITQIFENADLRPHHFPSASTYGTAAITLAVAEQTFLA